MERTKGRHFPQVLRYPFFFFGFLIVLVGGLGAIYLKLPTGADVVVAVVGFIFLITAIATR